MATIRPFRALRPRKELADKIASPPYDVISTEEAKEIAKNNPLSFVRIIRPEVDFEHKVDPHSEEVYRKGRENLENFIKEGYLFQDDKPRFYVYRQTMGEHTQVGLVACLSCEEYEKGIIKRHELTREEKEIDRAKHIELLGAQTGPVFITYRSLEEIDSLILEGTRGEPEYDFESDGVRHTFYVIEDEQHIKKIIDAFQEIPALYIADGHHRSAAAARVMHWRKERNKNHTGEEEYNYFLTVIFPHNHLRILDYNRVVKDLNGLSKEEFLKKIQERFDIEEKGATGNPYKRETPHTFGMYLDGKWYKLTAKSTIVDEEDPIKSLDVSILQEHLLDPILGIKNPRKDKRIDFVGGIRGLHWLEKLVDEGKFRVAFSMYPTTMDQLLKVADAGLIMPPKSTWFEPKLKSGLAVHLLD